MAWRAIDSDRVRAAIEAGERRTSGQIVVSISRFFWGNVDKAARRAFERIGVANTKRHNGVLVFVVPSRRRFVLLGDAGIHDKVGQAFWEATAAAIRERFRARDFTGGLIDGIEVIATQLASHYPPTPGDVNELPDQPDLG